MKTSNSSRCSRLFLGLCILCLSSVVSAAENPDVWWESKDQLSAEKLETILGSQLTEWDIVDPYGRPVDYAIESVEGTAVVATGNKTISLRRRTIFGPDTEIEIKFRLAASGRGRSSIYINMPTKDIADVKDKGFWFSASFLAGTGYISCSAADSRLKDQRVPYRRGTYYPRANVKRSLGWPDDLRRIVEHELSSLSTPAESWVTVRYILRKNHVRIYMNDRLFVDCPEAGPDAGGMLRIQLSPNTQLASVRTRRISEITTFEPVPIRSYLNASAVDRSSIHRDSLPDSDDPVLVNGVPFVFPEPDGGNDHIDLGSSWFRAGNLEGHLSGRIGPFGGRWPDPLVNSRARIQFRVPRGRYRAIHLIAACDSDENSTPVVTAQFYKPTVGFPRNFSARVPLFSAKASDAKALPVRLINGKMRRLYRVIIPVEPGDLAVFKNLDHMAVELTKEVRMYRAYPDPSFYSFHAAGLPSGVHVYAMTLERPAVTMTVDANEFANVWVAPAKPTYSVSLRNDAGGKAARRVQLIMKTTSYDGKKTTEQKKSVAVPAGRDVNVKFVLSPKNYGYHDVTLTMIDGDQVWNETLNLAYLRKDTRERGDWEVGRGPLWGFWNWGGGHETPPGAKQSYIMALAGAESRSGSFKQATEEEKKVAEQFGMVSMKHFTGSDHWVTLAFAGNLTKMSEEDAVAKLIEDLAKIETKPSKITKPRYISFFAEPHIGSHTYGNLPKHWGEPPKQFTEAQEARFQYFLKAIKIGIPAVKKRWPNALTMMPHGDPMFTALFLSRDKEVAKLIDGLAVDIPVFERLPEQQLHQVSLHRLWQCVEEYKRAGRDDLLMPMYEGPCMPVGPGSLTVKEQADLAVRCSLILMGYGVDQQLGGWCPFQAASYWGEQHYGGGICDPVPLTRPKPPYAAFATMTRHLNRKNFARWLPTGSLSAYAMEFKHYKTGQLVHVFWTIRGTRPLAATVAKRAAVTVYDEMDNDTKLAVKDGKITFEIDQAPCYVWGLAEDVTISLGEPDHSDASPAETAQKLGNIGDGSWAISTERDMVYENNYVGQIHRFPGVMTARVVDVAAEKGSTAAAVKLERQPKARFIMPYYTTFVPRRPIRIKGKASHLGIWARAASDWGRVIYSVKDAKGERWLSIGTKDQWNCDDIHNWSVFCFDGWRYLRFELPAHSPHDVFREKGTTWWGHSGGDGIVDLPLTLEKIIVERRTHVVYVNDPQPTRQDDVLLADLYAEYEREQDNSRQVVELSRLRMPVPKDVPDLGNPIADMSETGEVAPTRLTKISLPKQVADGTRCHVHFEPVEGAKQYDIWVSPYADGQGALLLGKAWKEPGALLRGLRPGTDFYLFLVHTDKDGKVSRPSAPLRIRLKDIFAMK